MKYYSRQYLLSFVEPEIVCVCAWCYPAGYALIPSQRHTHVVTHGICEFHEWVMYFDLLLSGVCWNVPKGNALSAQETKSFSHANFSPSRSERLRSPFKSNSISGLQASSGLNAGRNNQR